MKKENWRFSISFFLIYLAGTFNLVILNCIKISRYLILRSGETIFYGVLFSRFQKANMNFQHINFWWLHEIYRKEFSMNKESDKDEDESWILCTISLQINVISQQKIKKMKLPVHKTS